MTTKILYLPTNSTSLPHYFGRGIILPSKYYSNKPDDIQNGYPGALLLSSNMWFERSDCSVGIVITDQEEKQLTMAGNDYLFFGALPISRIVQVYFHSLQQKQNTVYNINAGTAYLPENLVQVKQPNTLTLNPPQYSGIAKQEPLDEKIKRFDILLGGIAFLSIAHTTHTNYPKDYFAVLSTFNKLIKEQAIEADKSGLNAFNDSLTGVFLSSKQETAWSKWQPFIFDKVDTELVEKQASKAGIRLEKKFGMVNLNNINPDSHIHTLALLATYGNSKSRSVEDLINMFGEFTEEKAQEIALIFGLNARYSGLRNEYNNRSVKFKLNTRLDYYTIESIYQYVFNNVKDNRTFDYIDSLIPYTNATTKTNIPHYNILDVSVIVKKKEAPLDLYLQNFEPSLKELQQKLGEFGKYIFEKTKEEIAKEYLKVISKIQDENTILKETITGLENRLVIETSKDIISDKQKLEHSVSSSVIKEEAKDGLDDLELKDLKKIAISKGINVSKMRKIKATKSGLNEIINLIRSTKELL